MRKDSHRLEEVNYHVVKEPVRSHVASANSSHLAYMLRETPS